MGAHTLDETDRQSAYARLAPASQNPVAKREKSKSASMAGLGELRMALPPINSVIAHLCKVKRKYGFDLDDIVIIAACGAINFAGAKQEMPFAQPANICSIAGYIRIPRETVRRKLQHIEGKGLVQRYSGAESGATRTPIPAQGGQQSGDCGQHVKAA